MEIGDERAEPLIEERKILTQRSKVIAMMIPPTEGESDTTGPRLDQTSGH